MRPFIYLIATILSISIELFKIGNILNNGLTLSNTLDLSWQTDSVERLMHGYIAGRDFIFTYGPLFQFIYSLPALLFQINSYTSIILAPLVVHIINLCLLLFIISNLFKNKNIQLYSFIYIAALLSITNFDSNNVFRAVIPIFYAALLFKLFSFNTINTPVNLLILFFPSVYGLYSYDLFIYCILVLIIFLFIRFYAKPNKKRWLSSSALVLIIFSQLIFQIFITVAISGNLNYLIYSLDTLREYKYIMNIPFSPQPALFFLAFPLVLLSFTILILIKNKSRDKTLTLIIFLNLVAFLQLNNLLTRLDEGHIIIAVMSSLFLLNIYVFILFEKNIKSFLLFITMLILIIPYKTNIIELININNISKIASANKMDFKKIYTVNSYYFSNQEIYIMNKFIKKSLNNIMIYPYDSYLLNINNTTYNTLALQLYPYSNSLIEKNTVDSLLQNSPEYIILGIDTKGAVMLDNIPNFSRNPLTAKWMLENYTVYKKNPKYLILEKGKNKNIENRIIKNKCTIYDINVSEIMKSNILEKLTKTSTYYLNNYETRLPYTSDTKQILIIENHTDPNILSDLFSSNIDFSKFEAKTKKLKIIKKHPIPVFKEVFEKEYSIKCYN